MKPREFDDLIRQKFDRSDFEYNPRSWDKLEDQLDGRLAHRLAEQRVGGVQRGEREGAEQPGHDL